MRKILLIGLVFAGVACKTPQKAMKNSNEDITTAKWQLVEMKDVEDVKPLFQDNLPYFELDVANERISGFAGCNHFNGAFKMANGKIEVNGPLAMTKKLCMDNGENSIIKLFNNADSYQIGNKELILYTEGAKVLSFKPYN